MATYIMQNTHRPEDCQALGEEALAYPLPASLKGQPFLCTCPSGTHGGVFAVQADDEADALALVGPKFRAGTRAWLGEIYDIGDPDVLPVAEPRGGA
ncbi:MAG TPA: hypothetical protein VGJ44_25450 [Kribbellaceae bacterium]|jgi:hypothetical protein